MGGPGELARKSNLSRRVIDKYRSGQSDPSRERLIAIANAANVSAGWLATGEGPMRPGDADSPGNPPEPPKSGAEEKLPPPIIDAECLRIADEFVSRQEKQLKIKWNDKGGRYRILIQVAKMACYTRYLEKHPDSVDAVEKYKELQQGLGDMLEESGTRRR